MDEITTIRIALTHTHALARIIVANQGLSDGDRVRSESCVRELLAVLYSRLNSVESPKAKLPDNIKSDY